MWYLKFFVYRFSVKFVDSIRKILGIMLHVTTSKCLYYLSSWSQCYSYDFIWKKKKKEKSTHNVTCDCVCGRPLMLKVVDKAANYNQQYVLSAHFNVKCSF